MNNINTNIINLSTVTIHEIFDYIHEDYKLLIHREGSTDEQRSKVLSIDVIMRGGMEDDFEDVLLCRRFKSKLCNIAAERGYVSTLRWARQHRCGWSADTCAAAARGGRLDCLMWLREHGCMWDKATCTAAAEGGHSECLKWARENGCVWDASIICWTAAWGGHLECLIWAREHDCSWDSSICSSAARGGHLECLMGS